LAKWKYLYCFFPKSYTSDVLTNGIKPSRLYGGNVIPVYPSRSQVEKAIKGRDKHSLVMLDTSNLDPNRIVKVDYNHMFYRGMVPASAIKLVNNSRSNLNYNPNIKKSLRHIHKPSLSSLKDAFNVPTSSILKKRRRL
jgi:hypothetical protein